jgi:hypothetical protein
MHHPSQRNFEEREIMFIGNGTDNLDCIKVVIFEISRLIHFPLPAVSEVMDYLPAVLVESAFFDFLVWTVFAGEESACVSFVERLPARGL